MTLFTYWPMINKPNISVESLRKDPEALGVFLAKDPVIRKYIEIAVKSGNLWKWNITEEDLITFLFKDAFDRKDKDGVITRKGWLSYDIQDVYPYLNKKLRNLVFSKNHKNLKKFLLEEFDIYLEEERCSISLDENPDNGRSNIERISGGSFEEAENEDVENEIQARKAEYVSQFKQAVEKIRGKQPVMAELLIRRMVQDQDYLVIAKEFLETGLIPKKNAGDGISEEEIKRVATTLSNSRYSTAYKRLCAVALTMGFRGLAHELESRKKTKKPTKI